MRNYDWTAGGQSKLVLAVLALLNVVRVFEKIRGIELIVAEKLPDGAVQLVGAGFDSGIENRCPGAAEFGTEARGLNFEFLDSIDGRKNNEVRTVQEVHGVGVVVNAVEQVVVLRGPKSIRREGAGGSVAASISLGRVHAGDELGKESKVAAVQGKFIDALGVHYLSDRAILRFKHGRGRRHLYDFGYLAGLECEIDDDVRAHVDLDTCLGNCLKALEGGADLIIANLDWREFVNAVGTCHGREHGGCTFVRQRDLGTADGCARGVRHSSQDGAGINLSVERLRAHEHKHRQGHRRQGSSQGPN